MTGKPLNQNQYLGALITSASSVYSGGGGDRIFKEKIIYLAEKTKFSIFAKSLKKVGLTVRLMVTFFNVFSYTFFKIQKPAWLQYLFQVLTCLPLNLVRTENDSRDSVTRFSTHGLVLWRPAWHTV